MPAKSRPRTCLWILSHPGELPTVYCGQRVGYFLIQDDDGNRVRQYHAFCPEHLQAAAEQDAREDEEASD